MISLIGTLIIGLVVGALARLIVPGKEPGGCLMTMVIGIAGSFVAFYLGRLSRMDLRASRSVCGRWDLSLP